MVNRNNTIIEKRLGIPPDYQYRALREGNYIQSNWHRNKLDVLRKYCNFKKNQRILDVGPGSGNFEFEFSPLVEEIVAIDYNDDAIKFLGQKAETLGLKNIKTKVLDVRNRNWYKNLGKFDQVVMIDVIEHMNFKETSKIIQGFYKILKKGGKVCIITPNFSSTWTVIESILDRFNLVPELGGKQHLSKFNHDTLKKLLESEDFKTKTLTTFNSLGYLFPNQKLSAFINSYELKSPFYLGNMLMILAVKN